jgi:outer membrane immunogenic protein
MTAAATPAWAQDSATGFSGPRAELRIGGETTIVGVSVDDGVDPAYGEDDQAGITFAGEVGYDFQASGNFNVGVYGGLEFSGVARCSPVFGGDEACLEADRTITLGARAGFQPSSHTLLYLKGGYSRTRLTFTYEDGLSTRINENEDVEGLHLGGGLEVALGRKLYTRMDYIYTDYSEGRLTAADTEIRADMSRHQLLLGVGIRF